ncbi:hypothetical protein JX265_005672 [Neoarthrinium moseri]|uniref:Tyrosinase copper-binding domain-containing protein n=1 Tax=Neoarthrinium moseri TaxID=1658444 RepID=A0A9P9WMZ2_9PEZI|nr:hypothetical protein JX265_005672 [Neoarthrinium moseri]
MKLSVASQVLCGASAVSAISLSKRDYKLGPTVSSNHSIGIGAGSNHSVGVGVGVGLGAYDAAPLPLNHYGWFETISIKEAKAGVLKHHSHAVTTQTVDEEGNVVELVQQVYKVTIPCAEDGKPVQELDSQTSTTTKTGGKGKTVTTGASDEADDASAADDESDDADEGDDSVTVPGGSGASSPDGVATPKPTTQGGANTAGKPSPASSKAADATDAAPTTVKSSDAQTVPTKAADVETSSTSAAESTGRVSAADDTTTTSATTSASPTPAVTAQAECANPNMRFEWRSYSDSDRKAFVDAFTCLMRLPASGAYPPAQNRYEDIVRVHQMMTSTIHGNSIFLVWHRYYTWTLEQIMREECGFDRAFPWWDETLDAGHFAESPVFTPAYFGSLPAATNGEGTCITDGAFAGLTCHIGPGTGSVDHCLARAVDESLTAQSNADFVNTCNSRAIYSEMENCAELGPHAYGHNGVGSVMADVSASPSDPVFFMHHLFVDRNFWLWQNSDASRKTTIDGCIDSADPCTPLTMDTVISVAGLRPDVTVRDVLNTRDGAMCYEYTY